MNIGINPKQILNIAIPVVIGLTSCSDLPSGTVSMEQERITYAGNYKGYDVEVVVDGTNRTVEMIADNDTTKPYHLFGIDANNDFKWDRIGLSPVNHPPNVYVDQVVFRDGEYLFQPSDARRIQDFNGPKPTDADVVQARFLLNGALYSIATRAYEVKK